MGRKVVITPQPASAEIRIGNHTVKISGATLTPIRVVKDVKSSTRTFIEKASDASRMDLELPSEEDIDARENAEI